MKNYFQSGLALGNPTGACQACNIDISWLFRNTSSLLWIDKIYVTNHVWDVIMEYHKKDTKIGQVIKLFYNMLDDAGLVRKINDKEITEQQAENIYEQIEYDLGLIKIHNGIETSKEDSHLLKIGDYSYCEPRLWSLYAALSLSYKHNASFTLSDEEMYYLQLLINLKYSSNLNVGAKGSSITEVLNVLVPQVRIWPEYVLEDSKHCVKCINYQKCSNNYLQKIEKNITHLLSLRNCDEIRQLCEIMDKITEEKFKSGLDIDGESLLHDVRIEALAVQKNIYKVFKRVDHWSKVVGVISGALSLGAFYRHPELVPFGGLGLFASNAADNIEKIYKDKYKWVNFVVSSPILRKDKNSD